MDNLYLCRFTCDDRMFGDGNRAAAIHSLVYRFYPCGKKDIRPLYSVIPKKGGETGIVFLIKEKPAPFHSNRGLFEAKRLPAGWLDHNVYHFRVTVNPVTVVNYPGFKKRRPVTGGAEILEWFKSRAPRWGFECLEAEASSFWTDPVVKNNAEFFLNKAEARGILKVSDRQAFKRSAVSGIGREKSYGCGFLRLRPVTIQ